MNTTQQSGHDHNLGQGGGFEIACSRGAIFRFVPAGPPTTDRRPVRDQPQAACSWKLKPELELKPKRLARRRHR